MMNITYLMIVPTTEYVIWVILKLVHIKELDASYIRWIILPAMYRLSVVMVIFVMVCYMLL